MSPTELMAAELGVTLGDDPAKIANALVTRARGDDAIAAQCVSIIASALQCQAEPGFHEDEFDRVLGEVAEHLPLADAAAWFELVIARGDFATLHELIDLRRAWDADARRALCVAVLPLVIALDAPEHYEALASLAGIAEHHAADAGDLPVAVPRLIEIVTADPDAFQAARALGAIGDPRAIEPLIAALEKGSRQTRAYWIAPALAKLKANAAVPALIAVAEETDEPLELEQLLDALQAIDRAAAAPFVVRHVDPTRRSKASLDIAEAGDRDAASAFFRGALRSTDSSMRLGAIERLVRIGDVGSLDAILAATRDAYDPVRSAAILALADLGIDGSEVWRALIARLGDNPEVTLAAALACQQLRPGGETGAEEIVRHIDRARGAGRAAPLLIERLFRIARRYTPPADPDAAREILDALVRSEFMFPAELIDTWRYWVGVR